MRIKSNDMKILMVCLGNICRSPLAEGILQHKLWQRGLDWLVDSAGTENYHIGEPPHPFSQKVAREHGIDISRQRARRFTVADFDRFDKIYAMASDVYNEIRWIGGKHAKMEKVDLFLNELYPGQDRSVPDPWYGPEKGYHEVFALLERCCDAMLKKYAPAVTEKLHQQ